MSDYDGGTPDSDFSTTDGAIDYTLPLGKVRLLILDTADAPADRLFSEDQLDAFLDLNDGNVRRTAAQALLVIALSEALLSKKIRTQDLSTDGPTVAAELRAQAKALTDKADADDAAAGSYFEVVPFCDPFTEGVEYRL
ncbi:hypothetical protein PV761_03260 [Arthrobacter sp. CC3]|uniref:hypothetical protein n=1 Tax=Arthrobacter sp. CC3 TaxID=3029185 RepID=UPI003265FA41